jgi:bifunctional polynucleotide phosphatase/kinase
MRRFVSAPFLITTGGVYRSKKVTQGAAATPTTTTTTMKDLQFTIGTHEEAAGRPIAAFDYDGTLVRAREGRTHARDVEDWRWMRPCVPEKLKALATTHRIYVITDQSKAWKVDQIRNVMGLLGIPITVLVGGETKKPETAWVTTCLGAEKPAFYVGDAAGRPGDWSDCDRVFAERLGVPFHAALDYFPVGTPVIREIPVALQGDGLAVIMVGYPGSGKSTMARSLVGWIDGDVFVTPTNMIREAKRQMTAGCKSVVFDSTGGTLARRKLFVDWAVATGLKPVIVWVQTDIETAMDWNAARVAPVPPVAFFVYRKNFVEPTDAEGAQVILIK